MTSVMGVSNSGVLFIHSFTGVILYGLPCRLSGVKNPPASTGDSSLIPGSGRSPGEGKGSPLQYSCLENPRDRRAWQATSSWGCRELDTTERLNNNVPSVLWWKANQTKYEFNHQSQEAFNGSDNTFQTFPGPSRSQAVSSLTKSMPRAEKH